MRHIKFKGRKFILFNGGAIATLKAFRNFEMSYAHLFPNGEIKRFNKVIGHFDDIKFGSQVDKKKAIQASREGFASFLKYPTRFLTGMLE